jgi:hypothetical protein
MTELALKAMLIEDAYVARVVSFGRMLLDGPYSFGTSCRVLTRLGISRPTAAEGRRLRTRVIELVEESRGEHRRVQDR